MKIRIFAAFIAAAAIIFLSCNWFGSKKKAGNPLVGEWKLDSVKTGRNDSNFIYFLIASAVKDSGGMNFSFTKDSIYAYSRGDVDTIAYSFDEKLDQLNFPDSSRESLAFSKLNDSLITLSTKDSTVFLLQKK